MNPDSFERKLARRPLRQVPPEWRDEVLAAAREAAISRHPSPVPYLSQRSTLNHPLSTLLWPHPRAWAGLAAVWLVIVAVNIANREDSAALVSGPAGPPSEQMRERLREQQQMLAELFDPPLAADRAKARVPRPQSFNRHEFPNACIYG